MNAARQRQDVRSEVIFLTFNSKALAGKCLNLPARAFFDSGAQAGFCILKSETLSFTST